MIFPKFEATFENLMQTNIANQHYMDNQPRWGFDPTTYVSITKYKQDLVKRYPVHPSQSKDTRDTRYSEEFHLPYTIGKYLTTQGSKNNTAMV